MNTLPTYFQLLTELIDKYNFRAFIQRFENIENNLQDLANNLINLNYAVDYINIQINTLNTILQNLQFQSTDFPPLSLEDYVKLDSNAKYILYGKTQEADTQIRLNKNFIYLIPFRLRTNFILKQVSVYKLFDRKINNTVYIGLYESDIDNNPTNKIFETEVSINRLFGMMSTVDELNIPLQSGRIYYFAITANDNLLLRGLTVNNTKTLFGLYTKTNKPLTGFILPNRNNILPDNIDTQKIVPYFEKVPAIFSVLNTEPNYSIV